MMRAMSLAELQAPLSGQLLGDDYSFSSVVTDSRSIERGALFVALQGENFDGHEFVPAAARAGAGAALVSRELDVALPQLQVEDTQRALGLLGAYNREQFQGMLVAITGSSGKTTVKNMVSAILSRRGKTLATEGNFNNEIGVPLTLLRLEPEYEFAVVEMGAAALGDIRWLCQLGRPAVSLLLNAMPAHLEGFGSLEQVAMAKGEIFDGLGKGDVAVINADQPWAAAWRERAGAANVIDFSVEGEAQVSLLRQSSLGIEGAQFTVQTPLGDCDIGLALPGQHNVANALAAIAVGLACELTLDEIREGLASVRPVAGRLSASRNKAGTLVIDDCYNANPGSVRAAIDTLAVSGGRRTLVLGAMRELGANSAALHRASGEYARDAGLERFWGVGEELREAVAAFGAGGRWFADCAAAVQALPGQFDSEDVVLIKGSRGARMERVLQGLTSRNGAGEA